MSPIHPVYIVDDDGSIRASIKFILEKLKRPCKTFSAGEHFLREARDLERGIVLLDSRMPGMSGHDVQLGMLDMGICMPVIIITGHGDVEQAVRALHHGAISFLEKPFRREALLHAIERGDEAIEDRRLATQNRHAAQRKLNALTPREREVMDGLAMGYPNKTIAFDLGISARTVEVHRANLMQKLEVNSLADALRIAFAAEELSDR